MVVFFLTLLSATTLEILKNKSNFKTPYCATLLVILVLCNYSMLLSINKPFNIISKATCSLFCRMNFQELVSCVTVVCLLEVGYLISAIL